MKRLFYPLLVLACVALAACGNDDEDFIMGPTNIVWENVQYPYESIGNEHYYTVPQEGGTYTFVCQNCTLGKVGVDTFVRYGETGEGQRTHELEDVKAGADGKAVTVTLPANDTITRYIDMSIHAFCYFGTLHFKQEGAKVDTTAAPIQSSFTLQQSMD